jgi:hypothetical protein
MEEFGLQLSVLGSAAAGQVAEVCACAKKKYYAFKLEELGLQLSVLGPAAVEQVAEVCACAKTDNMPSSWKSSACSCLCLGLPQLDRLQKLISRSESAETDRLNSTPEPDH